MTPIPFLVALPVVLAVYIFVEYKTKSPWWKLALKTLCSLLFVAAAVCALTGTPSGFAGVAAWFIAAFLLSAAGDVLLALPMKQSFLLGLGAFFFAQCTFAVAFSLRWGVSGIDAGVFALLAGGALLTLWNAKGMAYGQMDRPITLYALALSAMAAKAVSGMYLAGGTGACLAAAGGLLFYASDVVLAFIMFNRRKPKCLRAVNLVLYYAGQGLLALSLYIT
jgi:uncharacterized membrane protein YhhN